MPIAAQAAAALGLPQHPIDAARAAHNKRLARERLRGAGLPVPWFASYAIDDPQPIGDRHVPLPCVLKPLVLSGSRGVIRANTVPELEQAHARLVRLLQSRAVRALRDPDARAVLIESYIPGDEFAIEGLLERGRLRVLAIFDKPDPLQGPFFEETIYVTPSRADADRQRAIEEAVASAASALGLHHGPIHAECRVDGDRVFVLEVAARPIGGLCARALRFQDGAAQISLEELLLRHAVGEASAPWTREAAGLGRHDDSHPASRCLPARRRPRRRPRRARRHRHPDHREAGSVARAAAGRGELPRVHLCARGASRQRSKAR